MSQEAERRGQEDDWWRELYDERKPDSGPGALADSLDDRCDSAFRAVGPPSAGTAPGDGTGWQTAGEGMPDPGTFPGGTGTDPGRTGTDVGGAGRASGVRLPAPRGPGRYAGRRPSTYNGEPAEMPATDPDALGGLVPDTVLDGAGYGAFALRTAALRGDAARHRGEQRCDALLTARFGHGEQALVLVAMARGTPPTGGAHHAAAGACRWIGQAVGRHHDRLVSDLRAGRRGVLASGLLRLTDRSYGALRACAAELGVRPGEYTASLRCLLLPTDPGCRTRVFFGTGDGGLFRLRDGAWQDIEPDPGRGGRGSAAGYGPAPAAGSAAAERAVRPSAGRDRVSGGETTPGAAVPGPGRADRPTAGFAPAGHPGDAFRFRAVAASPGDTLLLCSAGLADPLRGEPAVAGLLAARWGPMTPPDLAAFLADVQVRVAGHADDRTAAAVWER
jgi:hypothetical protein